VPSLPTLSATQFWVFSDIFIEKCPRGLFETVLSYRLLVSATINGLVADKNVRENVFSDIFFEKCPRALLELPFIYRVMVSGAKGALFADRVSKRLVLANSPGGGLGQPKQGVSQ
jgi:hypothetical protein